MKAARVIKAAARLPLREAGQALGALAHLAYARLALSLLPFSRAIRIGCVAVARTSAHGDRAVRDCVRAVERASYAAPWRSVCIDRGLALQTMLRRRGVPATLCYGTRQTAGKLESHVWVKVGDAVVIGGEAAPTHHLVASYPSSETVPTSRPSSSLST